MLLGLLLFDLRECFDLLLVRLRVLLLVRRPLFDKLLLTDLAFFEKLRLLVLRPVLDKLRDRDLPFLEMLLLRDLRLRLRDDDLLLSHLGDLLLLLVVFDDAELFDDRLRLLDADLLPSDDTELKLKFINHR